MTLQAPSAFPSKACRIILVWRTSTCGRHSQSWVEIILLHSDVGALGFPFPSISPLLTRAFTPPPAQCSAYFSLISTPYFISRLSAFTSGCYFIPLLLLLHSHPCVLTNQRKMETQSFTGRANNFLHQDQYQITVRVTDNCTELNWIVTKARKVKDNVWSSCVD